MSKHTPGPWTVHHWSKGESGVTWHGERDGIGYYTGDAVSGVHFQIVAGKEHLAASRTFGSFEGCHICSLDVAWEGEGEAEANARLIAAAPRLLAACVTALHVLDVSKDSHAGLAAAAIRDAIALVEGKAG